VCNAGPEIRALARIATVMRAFLLLDGRRRNGRQLAGMSHLASGPLRIA